MNRTGVYRVELFARGAVVSEVLHAGTPGARFQPDGTIGRVSGPRLLAPATARSLLSARPMARLATPGRPDATSRTRAQP